MQHPLSTFCIKCVVKFEFSACYSCLQEVVLSSEQDAFFKANMNENFGDIGMNIKKMVDDFQQVAKSNQNIQTIGWFSVTYTFAKKVFHLCSSLTGVEFSNFLPLMLTYWALYRGYG